MKIGFTGTRNGMSEIQMRMVFQALNQAHPEEVHHGACMGADKDFHNIATSQLIPIVIHPGVDRQGKSPSRAVCNFYKEMKPEKFYLDRDKDIVDAVDYILACPKGKEEIRSGTWATIRYARKKRKQLVIIYPDGTYSTK